MHRSKSWKTRATKVRSQRNRLDSTAGTFNESFKWDFRSETLPSGSTFQRAGATATLTRGPVTQNLLKHSNTLSNADTGWSPSGELSLTLDATATTPIGGVNAPRLLRLTGTTMSQQLTQTIAGGSIAAGTVVTLVFWARAGTGSIADNVKLQVGMYGTANFATASNATVLSGSGTITGASLQSVDGLTSEWSKFSVTFTAVDSANHTIRFYPGVAGSQPVGLNVYVWGVQLYYGTRTDMPFVETTSAPITNPSIVKAVAANTPRFVAAQALYDRRSFPTENPVLSREAPIGLLLEGEAINRIVHSEDQSNAVWTTTASATKAGKSLVIPDPTGQLGFNKITNSAVGTLHGVQQSFASMGFVPPQGVRYTLSVWAAAESGTANLQFAYSATGTGSAFPPSVIQVTTTPRRYSATFNTSITGPGGFVQILTNSASILWWGAQWEANPALAAGQDLQGSNPSSYIPTAGAAVTRQSEALLISNSENRLGFNRRKGTLSVSGYLMQGGINPTAGAIPLLCGFITAGGSVCQAIYLSRDAVSASCTNASNITINSASGITIPPVNATTPPAVTRSRVSYSVDLESAATLNSTLLSAQSTTVFNQGTGVQNETFMALPDFLSVFNPAVMDPAPAVNQQGSFVVESISYIPNSLTGLQARELAQSFLQGTASLLQNGNLGYINSLGESESKFPSSTGGGITYSTATTWTCTSNENYQATIFNAQGNPPDYFEVWAYASAGATPSNISTETGEEAILSAGSNYAFEVFMTGRPGNTYTLQVYKVDSLEIVAYAIIKYTA